MIKKLLQLYPGILIQDYPRFDQNYYCFFHEQTNEYISIPKQQLTDREVLLLETILTKVQQTATFLNNSPSQQIWHRFLFENGELPKTNNRIRFIFFQLNSSVSYQNFTDSIYSFFQDNITLVWLNELNGFIIERETETTMQQEDFLSFQDLILTDFYLDIDMYIGRFFEVTDQLKNHFYREQYYFQIIRKVLPEKHLYTFMTAFPSVIIRTEWRKMNEIFTEEYTDIFQNDKELVNMIKVYLENNSNMSLAAKKLYMHRNSLQYKIDKFIKRTSIDIKDFNGAISVYFICVYGEIAERIY